VTRARPRRSCHAVSGSSERCLAKAPGLDADEVFLDLEDAVAPNEKHSARARVIEALNSLAFGEKTVVVRVNGTDTPHYYRDLIDVVEQAGSKLDAIMLPKVRTPGDVEMTDKLLTQIELAHDLEPGRIGIEAQIEDATGLLACEAIATACVATTSPSATVTSVSICELGPWAARADRGNADPDLRRLA
jgi:citrate lyase subunit beta/citryl-CoA lyase